MSSGEKEALLNITHFTGSCCKARQILVTLLNCECIFLKILTTSTKRDHLQVLMLKLDAARTFFIFSFFIFSGLWQVGLQLCLEKNTKKSIN